MNEGKRILGNDALAVVWEILAALGHLEIRAGPAGYDEAGVDEEFPTGVAKQ